MLVYLLKEELVHATLVWAHTTSPVTAFGALFSSANLQKTFRSLYQLVPACTSWYKPKKLGKLQE